MALRRSASTSTDLPHQILQQIIKPEYIRYYDDWLKYANENEARGLQLIGSVYKHKGRKKFRTKPPSSQLQLIAQQEEFDFKKAEEMFRKTQTTSYYQSEFGYLAKDLKPQNNIFKYKKCSQLELRKPLTDLAVLFIDNWIELGDELEFQEIVLSCLRSLYSRCKSQDQSKTEQQTSYQWKVDWKLSKPVRMDKAGADLKGYKKTTTMFAGGRKNKINEERIREFEQTDFAKSLQIFKSFKIN